MNRPKNSLKTNEAGMVAIIVTVILMLVVSLITLGFAKVVRREQRQALDRHLSTRAFYAAESGINIAQNAIDNLSFTADKPTCAPVGVLTDAALQIDGTETVVSCLMIDQSPNTLEYPNIPAMESQVIPIDTGATVINTIQFGWQEAGRDPSSPAVFSCGGPGSHPPASGAGAWTCTVPLLRVDIVPAEGAGINADNIYDQVSTFFIYPAAAGATANIVSGRGNQQGLFVSANVCDTVTFTNAKRRLCLASINGLTGTKYYVRVMSLYKAADLTVNVNNGLGPFLPFYNAQAVVDSTGRSLDVLRRLQVRLPLKGNGKVADFALQAAEGICKRYQVSGSSVSVSGGTNSLVDGTPCAAN